MLRMQSLVGSAIWWYVAFIAIYFLLVRDRDDAEGAMNSVVTMLVWSAALLVVSVLGWMMATVVSKGSAKLTWDFLTHDLSTTGPLDSGRRSAARHHRHRRAGRHRDARRHPARDPHRRVSPRDTGPDRAADPLHRRRDERAPQHRRRPAHLHVWVSGHGYSGAAGSAALVVLMLPTMTRATEEILRTVPDRLREGAFALGAPQWRLVQSVVLPTALAGIVTAALLAVARAIGETAPMLFTAFGADCDERQPVARSAVRPAAVRLQADLPSQPDPDRSRVDGGADPRLVRAGALRQRPPRRAARDQATRRNPMTTMLSDTDANGAARALRRRRAIRPSSARRTSARGSASARCSSAARCTWKRVGSRP